jgi:hypothetical protein
MNPPGVAVHSASIVGAEYKPRPAMPAPITLAKSRCASIEAASARRPNNRSQQD